MKEGHLRSIIKSISWRIVGTFDTIVLSYIITGQLKMAITIGGVELLTKILFYYLHERIWDKIKWGKK